MIILDPLGAIVRAVTAATMVLPRPMGLASRTRRMATHRRTFFVLVIH